MGFFFETGYRGFLYNNGAYTAFDLPGASDTLADAINDAGQIAGTGRYSPGDPYFGFVDTNGALTFFDLPRLGQIVGMNDSGVIVGTFQDEAGAQHGFVLTPLPESDSLFLLAFGVAGVAGLKMWRRRRAAKRTAAHVN